MHTNDDVSKPVARVAALGRFSGVRSEQPENRIKPKAIA